MPTIFTDLPCTRRIAVGASSNAQGLDGVPELARTAREALSAAGWTISTDAPALPVHEYDRAIPSGDAWKACYGYDAAARTERGACGCVCYSFQVPADALTGDPCNIAGVALSVRGDRYLDAGADLHVVFSASATPPTVAELLARTPDETGLCATSDQTIAPNQRNGVTAPVTISPASQAATAYIHVALLLTDYLGTRGAWIEGGALLVSGAISVEFSRAVSADSPETLALLAGKEGANPPAEPVITNRFGAVPAPRCDVRYICELSLPSSVPPVTSYQSPQLESQPLLRIADALFVASAPAGGVAWHAFGSDSHYWFLDGSVTLFDTLDDSKHYIRPTMRAVIRSGVGFGSFRALTISSAITAGNPLDLAVYALAKPCDCAIPGGLIHSDAFWQGGLSSIPVITNGFQLWNNEMATTFFAGSASDETLSPTAPVGVTPLAHRAVAAGETLSRIEFDAPLSVSGVVTIILAVAPSATVAPATATASTAIPATTELSLEARP